MRILIASPSLPWPLWSGGNAAQFSTLSCLAEDHDFTLVCPIFTEEQKGHAQELQKRLPRVRVRAVFCGTSPDSPLVRLLRPAVSATRKLLGPKPRSQSSSPWYPFRPLPAAVIEALQQEVDSGTDLCQVEFVEMLPLGAWLPGSLPKLFVHHQVHFVYSRRFLESHGRTSYGEYLSAVMRAQELAFLQYFDGVVTFGEPDKCELEPFLDPAKLSISPFPIPADIGVAASIPKEFDNRFLFVGSEEHGPNRDALDWLLQEIWSRIVQRLPQARLIVVGRWTERTKASYAAQPVDFVGFVSDLPNTLRGGIMLVPLRIGSGIRTKILAALAQGTPVVTTPVGAEGIPVTDGSDCMVRSDPVEFANAAVRVAQEPELWGRLAAAGIRMVARHYSPESVRRRRNEVYASVVMAHKQNHFRDTKSIMSQ